MKRMSMSAAASALHRGLLQRAGVRRNRILLTDWTSVEWKSLTFDGERHRAGFIVSGADAEKLAEHWTCDLSEAEFDLGSAGFVAEITLAAPPALREDGAVQVEIEALTIAD